MDTKETTLFRRLGSEKVACGAVLTGSCGGARLTITLR